eukprot:TRINITY_DN69192_c0_g1_i1.p1 TRINITY_DN69192_c0_g1~~TRINITY_DN69192_c0_g1_i1.p1  ORF type:complete len:171 (-),score=21.92 TRINITY_DN69192_c0_g1_i1:67-579(-)
MIGDGLCQRVCVAVGTYTLHRLRNVSRCWLLQATKELSHRRPAPGEYTSMFKSRGWDARSFEDLKAQTHYILTVHDTQRFTLKRNVNLDGVYGSDMVHIKGVSGELPAGGGILIAKSRFDESIDLLPSDESADVWSLRAAVAVADPDRKKQRALRVLDLGKPHERIYGDP